MEGLQKVQRGGFTTSYPVKNSKKEESAQSVWQLPKESGDRNDVVADWEKTVQATLNSLKNQYKNVNVVVGDFYRDSDLKQYAQQMGSGSYLVISQGFLDQMAADRNSFENGKALLNQVFQHLSLGKDTGIGYGAYLDENQVTYWYAAEEKKPTLPEPTDQAKTLMDWMKEAKEKAEKLRKSFQVKNTSMYYHQPTQVYAKLARAKTVGSVRSVMHNAQNKIYQLKRAISAADDKDKDKLRAVLSQLQGSVGRARQKVRSLEAETRLKNQQKKAEREQKHRKATRLSYEVRRRRTARIGAEYAQVNRSSMWALYMAHRDYQEQMQKINNYASGLSPSGSAPYTPAVSGSTPAPVSTVVTTPVSLPIA